MSTFNEFKKDQKIALLKEVLKKVDAGEYPVKKRFEDSILDVYHLRIPLTINGLYCGRDQVFTWKRGKDVEDLGWLELDVSFCGYPYVTVENSLLKQVIEEELEEMTPDFEIKEKPESIVDYSLMATFEDGRMGILARNSYKPSRALQSFLSYKASRLFLPVISMRLIHTDKELKMPRFGIEEKLKMLEAGIPVIDRYEVNSWEKLPEWFIEVVKSLNKKTYTYKAGVREDKVELYGLEIVENARKGKWSALYFVEEVLLESYKRGYTHKRRADNLVGKLFKYEIDILGGKPPTTPILSATTV